METQKEKLILLAKNLIKGWYYILGIVALLLIILYILKNMISYYNAVPDPISIDISSFGGKIISADQESGFSSVVKIKVPFDDAIKFGSDAIMVYGKKYCPVIQIYKSSPQSCGTFEYAIYNIHWKNFWETERVEYNKGTRTIICYPVFVSCIWFFIIAFNVMLFICMLAIVGKFKNQYYSKI